MTTDNPDPLEVFRAALMARTMRVAAPIRKLEQSDFLEADQAAAAIIAQHYAPVIAENERLREVLTDVGLTVNAVEQGRTGVNIAFDQMTAAIAQALGAKP